MYYKLSISCQFCINGTAVCCVDNIDGVLKMFNFLKHLHLAITILLTWMLLILKIANEWADLIVKVAGGYISNLKKYYNLFESNKLCPSATQTTITVIN